MARGKRATIVGDGDIERMVEEKVEERFDREGGLEPEIDEEYSTEPGIDDDNIEPDIFEDIGAAHVAKGISVVYDIYKDGQYLCKKPHPYSWERLKKDFGGGSTYRIIARNINQGKYIKYQSRVVSSEGTDSVGTMRDMDFSSSAPQPPPQPASMGGIGMMEMLTFIKTLTDGQVREAKQASRDVGVQNNQMLTMVTESHKATTDLIMKMNEINVQRDQKTASEFARVLEKLDEKQNKQQEMMLKLIMEMNSSKGKEKPEFTSIDVMKMMQDAEERGEKRVKMMYDLAEAKSDEKLEMYREVEGEKSSEGDSLAKTAIKAVLPLLGTVNQSMQQQNMVMQRPQAQPQPQRRVLPQVAPNQPQPSPRARPNPNQAPRRPAPQAPQVPHESPQVNSINETLGLASLKRTPDIAQQKEATAKSIEDLLNAASILQKEIATIAIPKLAECLATDLTPQDSSLQLMNKLKDSGYNSEQILEAFTFDFMWQIARSFGVDTQKKPWFEEFYANFQNNAGNVGPNGQGGVAAG